MKKWFFVCGQAQKRGFSLWPALAKLENVEVRYGEGAASQVEGIRKCF
jgi:hypothetical protein